MWTREAEDVPAGKEGVLTEIEAAFSKKLPRALLAKT